MMLKNVMHDAILINTRTTFTPAPDIADRLHVMAKSSKISRNEIVNELICNGLRDDSVVGESVRPYVVELLSLKLRPGLDEERLSEIAQQMDDEELIKHHGRP
jgi:hypothetical protein